MMETPTFRMRISCEGPAFYQTDDDDNSVFSPEQEIARTLRKIADQLTEGSLPMSDGRLHCQTIHDIHGNDVGRFSIRDED